MAFYMCPLRTRQLTKSNALLSEAQEDSGETTECWSVLSIHQILQRIPYTTSITFNEKSLLTPIYLTPKIERNSEKDIESMIRDAEANQEADAKRKETVEAKNELDS